MIKLSLRSLVMPALLLMAAALVAPATAQDEADLLAGKRAYIDGACHNCHGSRGQGGGGVDFPAGPSLRASQLDRDTMILFISCGMPGTRMPGWLQGAYTEVDCYGEPLGAIPAGTLVTGIFTEEQVGHLVDYIRHDFMRVDE